MKKYVIACAVLSVLILLSACGRTSGSAIETPKVNVPETDSWESPQINGDHSSYDAENDQLLPDASSDFFEADKETSIENAVSGIIYARYYYTKQSSGFNDSSIEIGCIDPESGAVRVIRDFSAINPAYIYSIEHNPWKGHLYETIFSPDYKAVAVVKNTDDGCMHVGWINEQNEFIDVTERIMGNVGDFGNTAFYDDEPFFDLNYQYLYFRRKGARDLSLSGTPTWVRVPLNNISHETVEELGEYAAYVNIGLDFDESFINAVQTYIQLHSSSGEAVASARFIKGWIDPTYYLAADEKSGILYKVNGETAGPTDPIPEGQPIIPDIPNRVNRFPVLSPDKTKVAFLSYLDTPGNQNIQLFVVPSDGSAAPQKLDTDVSFMLPSGKWEECIIIGWI